MDRTERVILYFLLLSCLVNVILLKTIIIETQDIKKEIKGIEEQLGM